MAHLDALLEIQPQLGPDSLADLCCRTICDNLDIITQDDGTGFRRMRDGLKLPSEICDKIIEFAQRSTVTVANDSFFTIFSDPTTTRLKRVKISSSSITSWSVMFLARQGVTHLEFDNCKDLDGDSLEYFAICPDLYSLSLRGCPDIVHEGLEREPAYRQRGYVFQTPNLRRLALTKMNITTMDYHVLLQNLALTHLDLSNAPQIRNFGFFELLRTLVSLCLYNVRIQRDETIGAKNFITEICHLKKLRHLDLSQSNHKYGYFKNPNEVLWELMRGLPELVSLDIGGTNLAGTGVAEHPTSKSVYKYDNEVLCDIPGLQSRVRKPLEYLGLYGTLHAACRRRDIPATVIGGDANVDQILIALRVCMNHKPELLQKILNDLYQVFKYEKCKRLDQALYMVLEAMEKHLSERHIQVSGSATLFYIVKLKEKSCTGLPVQLRRRIIGMILAGMNAHKDDETMMRNGCLALCQFRIPQDVMWNYEALVKVLLYSARYAESEGFVQRIGIYLLNSLACQVEGKKKRLLGKLGCVGTMLELVKYRVDYRIFDDVLEVAWSTMWNMTDETPINCQRFLDKYGMDLFLQCVKQYPYKEELLRNMMGLLGNVAEVDYLRSYLMKHEYVTVFTNLLSYESDPIEVSYNATGILAHIASDGAEAWKIEEPTRDQVLERMVTAIERWDLSASRNINYRSFLPLLRLLDVYHTPQCQHWAVWALANLTGVYPSKYCSLVELEGGIEKLKDLLKDSRPYNRIKNLAVLVILNCGHEIDVQQTILTDKINLYGDVEILEEKKKGKQL